MSVSAPVKLDRRDLLSAFVAIGFQQAQEWPDARLRIKVKELPSLVKDPGEHKKAYDGIDEGSAVKETIDQVVGLVEAGEEVEWNGEEPAPKKKGRSASNTLLDKKAPRVSAPAKPTRGEPGTPVNPPAKKQGGKKPAKEGEAGEVERDAFGSRLGTNYARVNACLTAEPKTERQLRDDAGLQGKTINNTIIAHLDKLVRLGLLRWKKGEGYYLSAKK